VITLEAGPERWPGELNGLHKKGRIGLSPFPETNLKGHPAESRFASALNGSGRLRPGAGKG
jgi:hypothetical protein